MPMAAEADELMWLWHKQFGHSNSKGLKFLSNKNMVKGLPLISKIIGVCDACELGILSRKSFPFG